jgi:hypothetical protein
MAASLELWNDAFLQNLGEYSVVIKVRMFKNVAEQDIGHEKFF